jgi:hypothetical protein
MVSLAIKSYKLIHPKEEHLLDLDAFIHETRFTLGSLSQIKKTIQNNFDIISDSFCSSLSLFSFEPTFPHPEFVHWVVHNYVSSTKQVISHDGSRIIVSINPQTLRKGLCLSPANSDVVQFTEEKSLAIVKALSTDQLYTFM